jgi:uncharacterized protein involved in exopolysaccharide biosynthesis
MGNFQTIQIQDFREHRLTRTEITALFRKYWLLVLSVFLCGTLGMWASFPIFFTTLFESKTILLVKIGRENSDTPGSVQRGQIISQGVRAADINSEVEMLQSRGLAEQVVDRLGPDAFKSVVATPEHWYGYPKYLAKLIVHEVKRWGKEFLILVNLQERLSARQEAIMRVTDGVRAEPVRDSDILVLKVQTPSPQLSVAVSNALLEAYMQARVAARRIPEGSSFFQAQVEESGERMNQAQMARAAIRSRWHLNSATEQRTQYLTELSSIHAEIDKNEAEIAKLRSQRDLMMSRQAVLPEMVRKEQTDANNPVVKTMKDQIASLQVERARLASRYLPDSEAIQKIDSQIADLEVAMKREPQTVVDKVTKEQNPSKRDFDVGIEQQGVQIAGLQSRDEALRLPEARLNQRLQSLTQGMDALETTDREYKQAEQDYLAACKRLEEARMSEELDAQRVSNVSVVAPPETPILPSAPNKLFLMGIAMVASLLLGAALAVIVETTDDRILDERNVVGMEGVTCIGTVSVKRTG